MKNLTICIVEKENTFIHFVSEKVEGGYLKYTPITGNSAMSKSRIIYLLNIIESTEMVLDDVNMVLISTEDYLLQKEVALQLV